MAIKEFENSGKRIYHDDMKNLLIRWLINAAGLIIVSKIIRGIHIDSFVTALVAAAILGIINVILRPIIIILTLPLNILTLGLFTFIINGLMLYIAGSIVEGFYVNSFWASIGGALLLSVINSLATFLFLSNNQAGIFLHNKDEERET